MRFQIAGLVSAFATYLIDGPNGLTVGVFMLIAGGLAFLAHAVSDVIILNIRVLVIWLSVSPVSRNPEVSPYAVLFIFFWSIKDILFSIFRRVVNRDPIASPERLHFH
jgi:UDP-N-acetylmuramyl pentapeptide phosphotransferase/UDP-N-acetylglucosamine-1-phosphate transferase